MTLDNQAVFVYNQTYFFERTFALNIGSSNGKIYDIKNPSLNSVLLNAKNNSFDALVPLTSVLTEADKRNLINNGYAISEILTLDEFKKRIKNDAFPFDKIFYTPSIGFEACYFNSETLAVCPLSLFNLFHNPVMSVEQTASKYISMFSMVESDAALEQFEKCAYSLPDRMAMEYVQTVIRKKLDIVKDLYDMFFSVYSYVDYGFTSVDKDVMDTIVLRKTPAQKRATTKRLTKYPEEITIYRGENSESTPHSSAYSWTLDENVANFFAARRGVKSGNIVSGKVKKSDVIEIILDRNESEIVVSPEKVYDIKSYDLYGMDYFNKHIIKPVLLDVYRRYSKRIDIIPFAKGGDEHGRLHEKRVLMLSLLLADALGLSKGDMEVLATVAAWHDTGRDNDGVDETHGFAGMKRYEASTSNPDSTVRFICQYHCIDDDIAYAELEKTNIRDKARCKLLFDIFKDADALDRVRFDLRDIDIDCLRNDISKQFVLIARIILENLK